MKFAFTPIALAALVAATPLAKTAQAETPTGPGASDPATTTEEWIVYNDVTYTPVVDVVSRHLAAARTAFDEGNRRKAAVEMRAVAHELKRQAEHAAKEDKAVARADKVHRAADRQYVRESVKRMNAGVLKANTAAKSIENGHIKSKADLDAAIDAVARADLDRRWLVTDVTTWYSVVDEPQRHFTAAASDYAKQDYKSAATEIRKATGYLRLEASRASGEAGLDLDKSIAQLNKLAVSIEKGAIADEHTMTKTFAKAEYALAVDYRAKAAESWRRKESNKAGYELKAANSGLQSAMAWAGVEVKSEAAATMANARTLGDKLAAGTAWTRDEVAKGFKALGDGIDAVGQKIGSTKKVPPFDFGA